MNAASSPVIVGSILLGADKFVADMVSARLPDTTFDNYRAFGVVRRGVLIGGVVYHRYSGHDIQASFAFDSAGWALPKTLRALFDYPFNQLGCRRMTALTWRKNKRSRKMIEGMGFKLEGVHIKGWDGIEDMFSFGMLKEDCRWIKDRNNGQEVNASRSAAA